MHSTRPYIPAHTSYSHYRMHTFQSLVPSDDSCIVTSLDPVLLDEGGVPVVGLLVGSWVEQDIEEHVDNGVVVHVVQVQETKETVMTYTQEISQYHSN